jgi:hypothetical protein
MKRKPYFLVAMLCVLIVVLIILANRSRATSILTSPTAIPPVILTQLAQTLEAATPAAQETQNSLTQAIQTQQAAQQTAVALSTDDRQELYPITINKLPNSDVILANKLDGTLAGYGTLIEDPIILQDDYEVHDLAWEEWTYDVFISVWAGQMREMSSQGIVWVRISANHTREYQSVAVKSPVQSGGLNIIGAVDERLILTSDQGKTFYFDVPSLRFVDTFDESVPIATPVPTPTLAFPPLDDAQDIPFYVYDYQLENTDLNYYINSPGDYDWFYFFSQAPGTLTVSLIPRGGNYGIRVVYLKGDGEGTIVGEDTTSGRGKKQVEIPDALIGDYMVRVWSLDGSYNENLPYTLRFDPPKPEKVTSILECVAANADGTFAAHFGYDNPNPFVVKVGADHDNAFHPGPIYRTGQPEWFVPGRVQDWFAVLFDGNGLTWTLDGHAVTANRNSPKCP